MEQGGELCKWAEVYNCSSKKSMKLLVTGEVDSLLQHIMNHTVEELEEKNIIKFKTFPLTTAVLHEGTDNYILISAIFL